MVVVAAAAVAAAVVAALVVVVAVVVVVVASMVKVLVVMVIVVVTAIGDATENNKHNTHVLQGLKALANPVALNAVVLFFFSLGQGRLKQLPTSCGRRLSGA